MGLDVCICASKVFALVATVAALAVTGAQTEGDLFGVSDVFIRSLGLVIPMSGSDAL